MIEKGKKHLLTAEYLLIQTYPTLKENKLLVTILSNLVLALDEGISFILESARKDKIIPPYNKDSLIVKIELFRKFFSEKYNIKKIQTSLMFEMDNILKMHKNSAFEFQRENKFVITDDKMNLQTITEKKTRDYYELVKKLYDNIE